jgi:hypothetical protein
MNFRTEREHDERFMALIEKLDSAGRLDVLESGLNLPPLGQLKALRRRQAFDVEGTFSQRRLLFETKVDSDEGGRWEAKNDPSQWQTEKIIALAGENDICLFITYGFSEFFTKPFGFGPAAAAKGFRHVTLDMMVSLLAAALAISPRANDPLLAEWASVLGLEQRKRRGILNVLSTFANFRRSYLRIAGDVDFTLGRIGVNAPEMAFPIFAEVLKEWGLSSHCQRYGRLSLYPIGRLGLPVDSVLNWWGLWQEKDPLTIGGALPSEWREALYLEVNEDFNLHLKLAEWAGEYVEIVRSEVARRLSSYIYHSAPVIASRPEFHKQGPYAIWEWDLDIPMVICNSGYKSVVDVLGSLLDEIVPQIT